MKLQTEQKEKLKYRERDFKKEIMKGAGGLREHSGASLCSVIFLPLKPERQETA